MTSHPSLVHVLILDDDPVYRRILAKTFETMPHVRVVAAVDSLQSARSVLETQTVDMLTLDVVLKNESGLGLLPWLAAHFPRVVTVLLTSGQAKDACAEVDALLLGASTLILKPQGQDAPTQLAARLNRVTLALLPRESAPKIAAAPGDAVPTPSLREIIAVGASTGGPTVVSQFIRGLPEKFSVPILITQHMPAVHVPYFADLLMRQSGRKTLPAKDGDAIEENTIVIAGDNKHMLVQRQGMGLVVRQNEGPEEHHCRPAVDPLFRSVAAVCGSASIGVVMTGMGIDGSQGALAMYRAGAAVVIQDQQSSVVWSMPGAVAALGAAHLTVAADRLAAVVAHWTRGRHQPTPRSDRGQ